MSPEEFQKTLRSLVHCKPFQPFAIDLVDGQTILIEDPEGLTLAGSGAAYDDAGGLNLIDCASVRQIRQSPKEHLVKTEFENHLRSFKYRTPFQPFVLDLTDGRSIFVDDPEAFGFSEGSVGFLSPDYQLVLVEYGNIRNVRLASPEPAQ